jgi:hypothetical protein
MSAKSKLLPLAMAGVLLGASASIAPAANGQGGSCLVVQAVSVHADRPSTLSRVSLPGGAATSLGAPGFWLNAMGYSSAQNLVYAVADGSGDDAFPAGAHVVAIDRAGNTTDLGPVRRAGANHVPWSVVTGATAGTIHGNTWYIRRNSTLYTVDLTPGDSFLTVLKLTPLRLVSLATGVDDFDYDPADGLLYGVSMSSRGSGSVVTINPSSGKVDVVPNLQLPRGESAGSVVIGADRALYVTSNREDNRSVTYRVARDSGAVTEVSSGPWLATSDVAGCLSTSAPPPVVPEPPPLPPDFPQRPPGVPTVPPRVDPPVSQPIVPTTSPTPTPTVEPSSSPSPTPTSPKSPKTSKKRPNDVFAETVERDHHTDLKRRWGLTALILIFGASAAAHSLRRR